MPHGLRTLGKGFLKECLERGERMLLDRGDMLKQGKHSVGPFLTKYNVCALKLCLSNGYVTPRATPFAQTHPPSVSRYVSPSIWSLSLTNNGAILRRLLRRLKTRSTRYS